MNKLVLLLTLLFTSFKYANNGAATFKPIMSIRLDRCTSYCNPDYCKVKTVCRPLNRTSKWTSMDIYFHSGVKLEAPVYVKIVANKKFATVYRPHMINFKTEFCNELQLASHPFIFGMRKNRTSYAANLLDPCPITGHRRTKPRVTNVFDYVSPLTPLYPAGEWRLDIILSVIRNGSEMVVLSWNDYYEIKSLTAEQF